MPVVSVKNVSKVYGSKKVLDNVSFSIEAGEIFGLLGSNGAGKSTITSIIFGLEYFFCFVVFGFFQHSPVSVCFLQ
jgi:ABC-type multidrug transport system ATPase subunit